jgi:phage baseplate assembly protein W
MEADVIARSEEIDFAPANIAAEIMQNVRTILTTPKYSVPLDRRFGVNIDILDSPLPKAMAVLQAEIITAVRRYEPRCRVIKVSFDGDMDGKLIPKVRIKIDEERFIPDTT